MPRGRIWNVSYSDIYRGAEEDHLKYGLGLGLQWEVGWAQLEHNHWRCS
jgi:hypothetical protein